MLDDAFSAAVSKLYVAEMGTESVAPLLYWLVRMLRPSRVLEIGMGFTTAYLAKAVADNDDAFRRERDLLSRSQRDEIPKAFDDYYKKGERKPHLVCIDRMTDSSSSATEVWDTLGELGLDGYCRVIEGDLRGSSDAVAEAVGGIDFAWVDTWDTLAFVREYWHMLNTAGGVLAVHYLMTYPEGRAVQKYLASLRGPDGGRLEMLNLLEPHKYAQNSLTVLRRVRDFSEPDDLRPQGPAGDPVGVLSCRGTIGPGEPAPSEA
jgi:predicted O-methyltransferase YrrM